MGIKGIFLIVLATQSVRLAYTPYRASWPAQIHTKTVSPQKVQWADPGNRCIWMATSRHRRLRGGLGFGKAY